MHAGAKTAVRTPSGDTDAFEVNVGVHQGSALSSLLFILVMEVLTDHIDDKEPWAMLFADDLVLIAKTKDELENRLEQ